MPVHLPHLRQRRNHRHVRDALCAYTKDEWYLLGACNPSLAHKALEAEPSIGVLLPCNVDVFVGEDGDTYVQAVRPPALFRLVDNPAVQPIAEDVDARLQRVLATL